MVETLSSRFTAEFLIRLPALVDIVVLDSLVKWTRKDFRALRHECSPVCAIYPQKQVCRYAHGDGCVYDMVERIVWWHVCHAVD